MLVFLLVRVSILLLFVRVLVFLLVRVLVFLLVRVSVLLLLFVRVLVLLLLAGVVFLVLLRLVRVCIRPCSGFSSPLCSSLSFSPPPLSLLSSPSPGLGWHGRDHNFSNN